MIYRKIVCKETSKIMKNKELDNLRSKINNIDDEILSLIKELSENCVLILSNTKGLFEKYIVVPTVFA